MSLYRCLLVTSLVLFASVAFADECFPYESCIQWAGYQSFSYPSEAEAEGDVLVILGGGGFSVVDISDPYDPETTEYFSHLTKDVVISGDLVLATAYEDGLWVVSIEDLQNPVERAMVPLTGGDQAEGIAAEGNLAVVCDMDGDFHAFDLSDPGSPVPVSVLSGSLPAGQYDRMALCDGYLYFMPRWATEVRIIDYRDPASPQVLPSLVLTYGVSNFDIASGCLYLGSTDGLRVYSLDDPEEPLFLTHLPGSTDVALKVGGRYGVVNGLDPWGYYQTVVVDFLDPASPAILGPIGGSWGPAAMTGNRFFRLTAGPGIPNGAYVGIIPTPQLPEPWFSTETPGEASDAVYRNGYLYVADGAAGVQVYDTEFPEDTELAGTYVSPQSCVALDWVDEDRMIVVGTLGVEILDLSSPTTPTLVAELPLAAAAQDVAVGAGFAYIPTDEPSFVVVDISDPNDPWIRQDLYYHEGHRVEAVGNIAYLLHSEWIGIYDFTDPDNPQLAPFFPGRDFEMFYDISVSGDLMVISSDIEIYVHDITLPASPSYLGSESYHHLWAVDLSTDQQFLYAYDCYERSVHIFDGIESGIVHRRASISSFPSSAPSRICAFEPYFVLLEGGRMEIVRHQCLSETAVGDEPADSPRDVLRAFPNPFNPKVTFRFQLAEDQPVTLRIHDLQGRLLRRLVEGRMEAGTREFTWDGKDDQGRALSSGVYFATLRTESGLHREKVVLLR